MTRLEVEQVLLANNVPTNYYSFGGSGGGDIWALERLDDVWTISYFTERGSRARVSTYPTENEACEAFLERINKTLSDEQHRQLIR